MRIACDNTKYYKNLTRFNSRKIIFLMCIL